jgi:hypothetical protein
MNTSYTTSKKRSYVNCSNTGIADNIAVHNFQGNISNQKFTAEEKL